MTGKTAFICLLAAGAILTVGLSETYAQDRPAGGQSITIFFTGNELGEMKPCGCSGGQLGGLDRRANMLNTVEQENRLIIDTGYLVPELNEQNLIKFNIIVQAFARLGYDVVNLIEEDIFIARRAGLMDGLCVLFDCITAADTDGGNTPAKFTKSFIRNEKPVDITVAVVGNEEELFRLEELFGAVDACGPATVNVLIVNQADPGIVAAFSGMDLVSCVIISPQSDEPMLISEVVDGPLIVSAGRLGKYVGEIKVDLEGEIPRLSFTSVAITEDMNQQQFFVELYKDYQRMLKEAGLLEKYPKFVLPDHLEYVGARSCKLCHDYEYQMCSTSPHADAFATLEKVGSDYDPECVICHVVGMQYESGFVSPTMTPELKNVDCEVCHGPGSEHLRSLGAIETSGPILTCTDCHTTEHSTGYAGHEDEYFEKIVHWREPVSVVRVREH